MNEILCCTEWSQEAENNQQMEKYLFEGTDLVMSLVLTKAIQPASSRPVDGDSVDVVYGGLILTHAGNHNVGCVVSQPKTEVGPPTSGHGQRS